MVNELTAAMVGAFGPLSLGLIGWAYRSLKRVLDDVHAEVRATNGRVKVLELELAGLKGYERGRLSVAVDGDGE